MPLFLLLLPFIILWLVFYCVLRISLLAAIWSLWCHRGRNILFVHSDSPVWNTHIAQHILPCLDGKAIVLNWSENKKWKRSLATFAFYHFAGNQEFNPIAIVFRPFHRTRIFRFFRPFRELKGGNPESLRKMEDEFFSLVGIRTEGFFPDSIP